MNKYKKNEIAVFPDLDDAIVEILNLVNKFFRTNMLTFDLYLIRFLITQFRATFFSMKFYIRGPVSFHFFFLIVHFIFNELNMLEIQLLFLVLTRMFIKLSDLNEILCFLKTQFMHVLILYHEHEICD